MSKPEMTDEQAKEMIANRPHAKVTQEGIEAKITNVEYIVKGVNTVCFITLQNGFAVDGYSACAHPDNYDAKLGEKIAYDNAFRKIWPLEGYLLKERLYQDGQTKPETKAA